MIWFYDFVNLSRDGHVDAVGLVRRIADLAKLAQRTAKVESKTYPCIFTHAATLDLLTALLPAVSGKSLEKNISPLIGKEGEPVLGSHVTIWDDGLREFGSASAPFDGEGMPRRRTPVFEQGVFRNFLFDLKTAAATNRKPTASASRTYDSRPCRRRQPRRQTRAAEVREGNCRDE